MKRICIFSLLLKAFLMCATSMQAQEPYAMLSNDNAVLSFYYDTHKAERNGMSVGPFSHFDSVSWYDQRSTITMVIFDASFANCTSLTSTAYWFYDCNSLATIEGIENLKTDNVTNMVGMFKGCQSLTSLDLSSFKTDNVTQMGHMFYYCTGLKSLDVSSFKTNNVTDMRLMFTWCPKLTSLDISGFQTDNVTDMWLMFYGCSGLTSLDLSSFKTDNVTRMGHMFYNCSSLTSLDLSNFNTEKVTYMDDMFSGCSV